MAKHLSQKVGVCKYSDPVVVPSVSLESAHDNAHPSNKPTVSHGEVFTKRWVVETILDLAGYTADLDLAIKTAIEPACGDGAFLVPIAERLIESMTKHGHSVGDIEDSIRAFDLSSESANQAKIALERVLIRHGLGSHSARLANHWVSTTDYLLHEDDLKADFVLGNPPYVRHENIDPEVSSKYRTRYPTMTGRADLFIPFYERSLLSLKDDGVLGFICADRWMRNQYGRGLRQLISDQFAMELVIEMHEVDAFEEVVSAYPAITIIRNSQQEATTVIRANSEFGRTDADAVTEWIKSEEVTQSELRINGSATRLNKWFEGSDSWPTGSPARLRLLAELNDRLQSIENVETGTRIGIGVASGADGVFVTQSQADVEPSRLLPLAMSRDIATGSVEWSKRYLVNPWEESGDLVDLREYPRLRTYFEGHSDQLKARHIAKKRPDTWYKTIDKVNHGLVHQPKLLFPDMKMSAHPVLEPGGLYPHHNLYFIVSREWDLEVLGGILLSRIADLFVDAYSVRMRGGTLRFQAQYLRKIRVPDPRDIESKTADQLRRAFRHRNVEDATTAACIAYGITEIPD